MDKIQKVLVEAGRKDLAQKYYIKTSGKKEVDWYVEKFEMRMRGSSYQTAMGWIEGANMNPKDTKKVKEIITKKYYKNKKAGTWSLPD